MTLTIHDFTKQHRVLVG